MAKKKDKYEYWHVIVNANEDRDDWKENASARVVGNCVSHCYKKEGRWHTINIKTGEESWLFDVEYIGRISSNLPKKDKGKIIIELKKRWELQTQIDKIDERISSILEKVKK